MPRFYLLIIVFVCGCLNGDLPAFPEVSTVERISIDLDYQHDSLPSIVDGARIAAIVAFVNQHRGGYEVPWIGVPVPRVRVGLHRRADETGAIAYFGAGPGFFERSSSPGDFGSKSVSAADIAAFLALIGAPPTAAGERTN